MGEAGRLAELSPKRLLRAAVRRGQPQRGPDFPLVLRQATAAPGKGGKRAATPFPAAARLGSSLTLP